MLLLLTIKLAITSLVFATGLSATREDLFWIWRHPPLLARSFLAMYILVPLVAIAMVLVFDLPSGTEIGLLFLSISAGAPLLPRKHSSNSVVIPLLLLVSSSPLHWRRL